MKIPTALASLANSKSELSSEEPSQQPDKIWLTVPEAAALLKIRPNAVVKRILKGTLEGKRSEDIP